MAQIFKRFYHGFTKESLIWFTYNDDDDYELSSFRFSNACIDGAAIFTVSITPGILPVGFHSGRNQQHSYEFYYPSVAARQLGLGQLPIGLYFADKLKAREVVNNALEFDRVHMLVSAIQTVAEPPI